MFQRRQIDGRVKALRAVRGRLHCALEMICVGYHDQQGAVSWD